MDTSFTCPLPMKASLSAALLALLAGCASTQANYASKGVLLDDGSYYFPARDGQGDYYHAQPRRDFDQAFLLAYGRGPFWSLHCPWSAWHCPPWPHGFYSYPGFGHYPYLDPGWGWHGLRPDRWPGSRHPSHPPSRGRRPRTEPGPEDGQPGRGERLHTGEATEPAIDALRRGHRGPDPGQATPGRAERAPARRDRDDGSGPRRLSRPEPASGSAREAGNVRIRERNHDRDG